MGSGWCGMNVRRCGLGKAKKVALITGDSQDSCGPAIHGAALPGWRDAEQSCGQVDRTTRLFGHRRDRHRPTIASISLEY